MDLSLSKQWPVFLQNACGNPTLVAIVLTTTVTMVFIDVNNLMKVGQKLFVVKQWHWSLSAKICYSPENNLQI